MNYKSGKFVILLQKLGVILYYSFRLIGFNKNNIGIKLKKYCNIIKLNFAFLFGVFWLFIQYFLGFKYYLLAFIFANIFLNNNNITY